MIAPAINYIKTELEALAFTDRVAGLARTVSFTNESKTQRYPVSCDVSHRDCTNAGKMHQLVPDARLKSLIYFEENGARPNGISPRGIMFSASVTLVCWLNLKKLGQESCEASIYAQAQVVNLLNSIKKVNIAPLNLVSVSDIAFPKKSAAIFSQYTYDETQVQYLLYPYDYFAVTFTLEFELPHSCINNNWINPEIPC